MGRIFNGFRPCSPISTVPVKKSVANGHAEYTSLGYSTAHQCGMKALAVNKTVPHKSPRHPRHPKRIPTRLRNLDISNFARQHCRSFQQHRPRAFRHSTSKDREPSRAAPQDRPE